MRLRLLSTILLSCCILITQGCTDKNESEHQEKDNRADAKDANDNPLVAGEQAPAPVVDGVAVAPIGDVVDMPVALPLDPLVPAPIPGGGGGSQGAIRPTKTRNRDHRDHGNRVYCGNGVQEADGKAQNCPYDIYGTTYSSL